MEKMRAAYRVSVIIGLVMMASLLIYAVIVGQFEKGTIEFPGTPALTGNELDLVKFALVGISVVIFFLIRIVNARIPTAKGEQGKMPDSRPRSAVFPSPEFSPLVTAAVVTYGFCEAPAIFGLVLYFVGRNSSDFHLFLLISLFFFAVHFPRFSRWEEWYRRQQPGQGMKRP